MGGRIYLQPRARARVHLGCGEVYLAGYLNVDFPPSEGTIGGRSRPDVQADIRDLRCPHGTLAEIRLHHVFEHFDRTEALALLIRWYDWLAPQGVLTIETPDFEASIAGFADRSLEEQTLILRHIFGSQEARWAHHLDGWSENRFRHILSRLGFEETTARPGASDEAGLLRNTTVRARKPRDGLSRRTRVAAAMQLLELSMNGSSSSELALLERWREAFESLVQEASEDRGGRTVR